MNDFTKEELEDICRALCEHGNPMDNYDKLINKIQSMIDNYCLHSIRSKYGDCIDCGHEEGVVE